MPSGGKNRGKGRGLEWLRTHVGHEANECLIWPQSRTYQGYGQLGYFGKVRKAHNIMCMLAHGPAPSPKHEAAHNCGNGHLGCVHPKHLEWKTRAENYADTVRHGTVARSMPRRLTIDLVEEIRASEKSCVDLAAAYGVSVGTIFKIKRRETWVKPRSKLTMDDIRSLKDAPEGEAIALGRSLGLFRYKVLKIRAGALFSGIE